MFWSNEGVVSSARGIRSWIKKYESLHDRAARKVVVNYYTNRHVSELNDMILEWNRQSMMPWKDWKLFMRSAVGIQPSRAWLPGVHKGEEHLLLSILCQSKAPNRVVPPLHCLSRQQLNFSDFDQPIFNTPTYHFRRSFEFCGSHTRDWNSFKRLEKGSSGWQSWRIKNRRPRNFACAAPEMPRMISNHTCYACLTAQGWSEMRSRMQSVIRFVKKL